MLCCALLACAAFGLAGCQNNASALTTAGLEKMITDSQGDGKYIAEQTWQDSIYTGNKSYTVEIDAEVQVPDVERFPVAEWRPYPYTNTDLQRIFQAVSDGKELRQTEYVQTREDIQNDIDGKKALIERVEREGTPSGEMETYVMSNGESRLFELYDYESYSISPDYLRALVEEMEETKRRFPSQQGDMLLPSLKLEEFQVNDTTRVAENVSFHTNYNDGSIMFYAGNNWALDEGGRQKGYISSYINYSHSTGVDMITDGRHVSYGEDMVVTKTIPCPMSKQEAEAKAKEIIEALGEGDLQLYSVVEAPYEYEYGANEVAYYESVLYMGWRVMAVRSVGGVPITPDERYSTDDAIDINNAHLYGLSADELPESGLALDSWGYEYLSFSIGDKGPLALSWYSRCTVGETINDDVKLLPFEDIKLAIVNNYTKNAVRTQYALIDEAIKSSTHKVYSIKLGMMQTKGPDGSLRLLPVWDVYATVKNEYDETALREIYKASNMSDQDVDNTIAYVMQTENHLEEEGYNYSVLTINAIDGSVINRNRGY